MSYDLNPSYHQNVQNQNVQNQNYGGKPQNYGQQYGGNPNLHRVNNQNISNTQPYQQQYAPSAPSNNQFTLYNNNNYNNNNNQIIYAANQFTNQMPQFSPNRQAFQDGLNNAVNKNIMKTSKADYIMNNWFDQNNGDSSLIMDKARNSYHSQSQYGLNRDQFVALLDICENKLGYQPTPQDNQIKYPQQYGQQQQYNPQTNYQQPQQQQYNPQTNYQQPQQQQNTPQANYQQQSSTQSVSNQSNVSNQAPVQFSENPNPPQQNDVGNIASLSFQNGLTINLNSGGVLKEKKDVIVNAANNKLIVDPNQVGGIAKQIGLKGGNDLVKECDKKLKDNKGNAFPNGSAVITGNGNLNNCKAVVHAVAPDKRKFSTNPQKELEEAYFNSLVRAHEGKYESIAFPSLGTGIFGNTFQDSSEAFMNAVTKFNKDYPGSTLKDITISMWESDSNKYDKAVSTYKVALQNAANAQSVSSQPQVQGSSYQSVNKQTLDNVKQRIKNQLQPGLAPWRSSAKEKVVNDIIFDNNGDIRDPNEIMKDAKTRQIIANYPAQLGYISKICESLEEAGYRYEPTNEDKINQDEYFHDTFEHSQHLKDIIPEFLKPGVAPWTTTAKQVRVSKLFFDKQGNLRKPNEIRLLAEQDRFILPFQRGYITFLCQRIATNKHLNAKYSNTQQETINAFVFFTGKPEIEYKDYKGPPFTDGQKDWLKSTLDNCEGDVYNTFQFIDSNNNLFGWQKGLAKAMLLKASGERVNMEKVYHYMQTDPIEFGNYLKQIGAF